MAVRHLALIPDGNRRWARARGQGPGAGHRAGIGNVGRLVAEAWDAGVETVTFWWGSPANLTRRDPAEVADIVGSLRDWLGADAPALLARYDATFEAHGRWRELCPEIGPLPRGGAGPRRLVLLMAYDGREELLAGAHDLPRALWTGHLPPVDLLVRTGGEPHLSAGFMLWHLGDAMFSFLPEMWPELAPERLRAVLAEHAARPRRFGA